MSCFRSFVCGNLDCAFTAAKPERFFNLCRSKGIDLQNIREEGSSVCFNILLSDYKKIRPLVRKCHCVPKIVRRKGLPFIFFKYRRHKAFFMGILLAMLLLQLISGYIWNIEIEGNFKHTDEVLTAFMKDLHIYTGQKKSRIDTALLEEELRLQYNDISWVSARIDGTVLKIELKEGRVRMPDSGQNVPGDLLAAQDGIIESIIVRSGSGQVKAGDHVSSGDVLILGTVDVYGDDGAVKNTHRVRADGDVYARVIWHCQDYFPSWYTKKIYTGREKSAAEISAFGACLQLGKIRRPPADQYGYEQIEQVRKYRLTDNFYLPVQLRVKTLRQYIPQKVYYTKRQQQAVAQQMIGKFLEEREADGARIIAHDLTVTDLGENYMISGDVEMIIPLTQFVPASAGEE